MDSKAYSKLLVETFPQYTESFLKDLKKLNELFEDRETRAFFLNILISNKDKKEVLEKIVKGFSKETKNLLLFLSQRKRYDIITSLYQNLEAEWMKKEGSVRGELIFPEKPSKKAVQSSVKILKNMMKLDIEYKIDIDKDIIGGFVFKTDKFIVDLSVKYQLQKLKEAVLK